jgi:hypothetical protein
MRRSWADFAGSYRFVAKRSPRLISPEDQQHVLTKIASLSNLAAAAILKVGREGKDCILKALDVLESGRCAICQMQQDRRNHCCSSDIYKGFSI